MSSHVLVRGPRHRWKSFDLGHIASAPPSWDSTSHLSDAWESHTFSLMGCLGAWDFQPSSLCSAVTFLNGGTPKHCLNRGPIAATTPKSTLLQPRLHDLILFLILIVNISSTGQDSLEVFFHQHIPDAWTVLADRTFCNDRNVLYLCCKVATSHRTELKSG